MNTKLTLRLDKDLIESAKKYAGMSGKSVSQMVSDYFYLLDKKMKTTPVKLTPKVKKIKGVLKHSDIDVSDYKRYLEEKYL